MAKPIAIEHVFKVFGDAPQAALDLVRQGCSKQEILERTGQSIGVFDAISTLRRAKSSSSWASRAPANQPWCACSTA